MNPNQEKEHLISPPVDEFFIVVADIFRFCVNYFREAISPPYEFAEIGKQSFQVGYKSISLISLTGFIVGIVFAQQSRPSLATFGAASWLPSLIGLAIIRALAPLMTAIICSGKVGSGIGAELGSMKVTEQIDAMEISATNPFKYLVVSRVTACALMTPILMVFNAFLGIMGGFFNVSLYDHTSFINYINNVFQNITLIDCISAIVRALVYGFTVGLVSCYQGYNATSGTEGVGRATNTSVIAAIYLIFIEEVIIVQIITWTS